MAPAAIESENLQRPAETSIDYSKTEYKYAAYLPYYTPGLQPPLQEFQHSDPGHRASAKYANLLNDNVTAVEISSNVGTGLLGIQLSSLTSAQKDDLALLAAERGVVVFRDQGFADIGPERQREFEDILVRFMSIRWADISKIIRRSCRCIELCERRGGQLDLEQREQYQMALGATLVSRHNHQPKGRFVLIDHNWHAMHQSRGKKEGRRCHFDRST
ncbi:uncharacterized protein BDW70DRAFT_164725 [Aspergillus foveolatus]|uniref:uncharacterized protein n=1 Tax=Aspergillus foveolatus TaxID=210207 RepID=UPI003CCE47D1